MRETEIDGREKRSPFGASRIVEADDEGQKSVDMLGLVLVCSLVGWGAGIVAMIFLDDPSVMVILSVVVFAALTIGAVLISAVRLLRGE